MKNLLERIMIQIKILYLEMNTRPIPKKRQLIPRSIRSLKMPIIFTQEKMGKQSGCKINPPVNVLTRAHNILNHLQGPMKEALKKSLKLKF